MKITDDKIRVAARELNKIVNPNVDAEGDIHEIRAWIERVLGAVPPVLEPTDVFTEETTEVLHVFQFPEEETEDDQDEEKDDFLNEEFLPEKEPETGPEAEDVDFIELPEDKDPLLYQVRYADGLKVLKNMVNANDEFKSLQGTLGGYKSQEILRDKMIEILSEKASLEKKPKELPVVMVKDEFRDACPKLSPSELEDLEKLILKDGRIIQPLLLWKNYLIDGHNRYSIALKHNIPFTTQDVFFKNEEDAVLWIKENAISQRNLTDYARYLLVKDIEVILKAEAKKNQSLAGKGVKVEGEKKTVREKIAAKINVSPSQLQKIKEFDEKASDEIKEKVRTGEVKLGTALKEIRGEVKPEELPDKKIRTAIKDLERWISKNTDPFFEEFTDQLSTAVLGMKNKIKNL